MDQNKSVSEVCNSAQSTTVIPQFKADSLTNTRVSSFGFFCVLGEEGSEHAHVYRCVKARGQFGVAPQKLFTVFYCRVSQWIWSLLVRPGSACLSRAGITSAYYHTYILHTFHAGAVKGINSGFHTCATNTLLTKLCFIFLMYIKLTASKFFQNLAPNIFLTGNREDYDIFLVYFLIIFPCVYMELFIFH